MLVDRTAGDVVRTPRHLPRRGLTLVGGRRILATLVAALIAIVALASSAHGHATLLVASPVINGSTPTAPAEVTLVFDELVTLAGEPVHLRGADGRPVTLDAARLDRGGRVVSVALPAPLARGLFTVRWQVVASRAPRWAVPPLLAAVAAEAVRAHPAQQAPGWGALLTGVHLLAAAVWVRALVQVVRTALRWRGHRRQAWALVGAYAPLAGWLFAVVVATGTVAALLLVPWADWTGTAYGGTLLVKIALVGAAAVLALLARRRLRRAATPGPTPVSPGWAVRAERAVLALVLAATAVLVSLPAPAAVGSFAALPVRRRRTGWPCRWAPAPARSGSARPSRGQLVVHLSAPGVGNLLDEVDRNRYRLSGAVAAGGGQSQALTWRGCGPGCFVAATSWGVEVNQMSLFAAADGWAGGPVSLALPWPAQPGDSELRRTVAAMRGVCAFALYEQVSSDTRTGGLGVLRPLRPLRLSGVTFLAAEPYGAGAAGQVAAIGRQNGQDGQDGQVTLAVGFPADLTQAQLVADDQGRIVREVLTAPNHLITRAFVYPEQLGNRNIGKCLPPGDGQALPGDGGNGAVLHLRSG